MTDKQRLAAFLGWRLIVVLIIAVVAVNALALLLIPQLSLAAAVRGGTTAIVVVLAMRIGLWLHARSREGKS
jgi:hypothetical protein